MIELATNISEPVTQQNLSTVFEWLEVEYVAYNEQTFGIDNRTGKHYNGIILEAYQGFSTVYPLNYLNRRINRVVFPRHVNINGFRVYFPQGTRISVRGKEKTGLVIDGGIINA